MRSAPGSAHLDAMAHELDVEHNSIADYHSELYAGEIASMANEYENNQPCQRECVDQAIDRLTRAIDLLTERSRICAGLPSWQAQLGPSDGPEGLLL